jgi:hypothetical protein
MGILLFFALLFDLVVWGGVKAIPEVGPKIRQVAQTQAPLVLTYMVVGEQLDALVPGFGQFGTDYATQAFGDVFQRIKDDPNVAVIALFQANANPQQSIVKIMFWAVPVLLVLFLFFWWRRPRQVTSFSGRRR